jgi:rhamnose transport system permease protein
MEKQAVPNPQVPSGEGGPADDRSRGRNLFLFLANIRETSIFVFIILLVILVSLRSPYFLNVDNFRDIFLDIAILSMIAIGQMMVVITRGIDLSVGSGIGLSAMAIGMFVSAHWGMPPWAAVLMGIGLGILLGGFNGFVVTVGRVPPIIATLGTLSIYRGLVYVVSQGAWVDAHELPHAFKEFTLRPILGIPALIIYAAIVAVIFYYFLNYTRTGRQIYAVGSNPTAAQLAGIRVNRIIFMVFVLSGALYGMGGVMWVSRYANAANNTALGWELQSVAAVVIGGVSIFGGTGTLPGALLGSLLLGIINNAVNLVGISPFWKQVLYGLVILAAVVADSLISRRLQRTLTLRTRRAL